MDNRCRCNLQGSHQTRCDLLLYAQCVLDSVVIALGPHACAVLGVDQLSGDSQAVTGTAHAAVHEIGRTQQPANCP